MSIDKPTLTTAIASALAADLSSTDPTLQGNGGGLGAAIGGAIVDAINGQAGTNPGEVIHVNIDIPLATLQAKTSTTPFNIGAALPTNARLLKSCINVVQVLAGGSVSAAHITIQNTSETGGAIQASTNVFTGVTAGSYDTIGSNPHPNRGGQQLQATVTTASDTMANLTSGHLSVDLYYAIAA